MEMNIRRNKAFLFFDDSRSAETQSSYFEHFTNPTINGDSDWATGLMTGILSAAAVTKSAPRADPSKVTDLKMKANYIDKVQQKTPNVNLTP